MTPDAAPLTVGTAGHIDHGKTALVRALTGVDTDRLPEEKARGITIVLGFAELRLPGGRALSLVDVPGHERLVRVMVSGASGIDLFLLTVAADDGVMPQTIEHVRVLQALGVDAGVVAITKSDLADPAAAAEVSRLLPAAEVVACSARTGAGVGDVAAALHRAAARIEPRARAASPAVLHIDRVFTIVGAGTVVTGTLWWGAIAQGERLELAPGAHPVRVRGLQVHDRPVERATAGQRVAVNVTGVARRDVTPGDVLVGTGAAVVVSHRIEARLALHEPLRDRERVQVHHGTRAGAARAMRVDDELWQLRSERPFIVADGDRVVVRRIAPPGTLGGGVVVDAAARGRRTANRRPGDPPDLRPGLPPPAAELDAPAIALEERLRLAGHEPPSEQELGDAARHLPALRAHGRAVRVGRAMHAHPEAIAAVGALAARIVEAEGSISVGRLRDELGTSRRYASALLEHLDATRVTLRLDDDRRIMRRTRPRG